MHVIFVVSYSILYYRPSQRAREFFVVRYGKHLMGCHYNIYNDLKGN